MTFKLISIYIMSLFYVFAGIKHFTNLNWYMKIMPPYLPLHKELVYIDFKINGKLSDKWQDRDLLRATKKLHLGALLFG